MPSLKCKEGKIGGLEKCGQDLKIISMFYHNDLCESLWFYNKKHEF